MCQGTDLDEVMQSSSTHPNSTAADEYIAGRLWDARSRQTVMETACNRLVKKM